MPEPILILGAGINGAAIARELALNGVGVVIVDQRDVAAGATAGSSRLIHGGLRYLEYGEFDLVREALGERTHWLQLAPQYVRPLRLFIPIGNRTGGLCAAAAKFLRLPLPSGKPKRQSRSRGLWPIGLGLWLYDRLARDSSLPRRRLYHSSASDAVAVDPRKYHWQYAFSDAQAIYPERFTLALLEDARQAAQRASVPFQLLTYHRAALDGTVARIAATDRPDEAVLSFSPSAIVNATGAWVDRTLATLKISSPRLIGGTKGSHILTHHAGLRERMAGRAIYVEAPDGRPVFVLPFGRATLVGTTDIVFDDDPAQAVASPEELDYLLSAVNELFSDLRLSRADVELHYSGVRPLPFVGEQATAGVTRRHWLAPNPSCPLPLYSVVGGKLTTCRSLAEKATATILAKLGQTPRANSRGRPLPGGESYPPDDAALAAEWQRLAGRVALPRESIEAVWSLVGNRAEAILAEGAPELVPGTMFPRSFVHWVIRNEWATTLGDLIERRLMLLYQPNLSRGSLRELAALLVEAGRLAADRVESTVDATAARLATHFGKRVS